MKQIRWGIVGCGDVTEVKSGPALRKIPGSGLVAVMRRDREKARDYAERHGVPRWYDDAEELIRDPQVDAVYVATPPGSHAEYTIRAAQAGKPVYVEKPMARTGEECERMNQVCAQAGVPLFVAYYRRCLPAFLKVKDLVESGAIGEVRLVTVQLYQALDPEEYRDSLPWRVQPELSGGGLFLDLGSHQLDFLDYVLGPIATARGQAANQAHLYPAEDVVCAHFEFASGVLGSGAWCFTVAPNARIDRTEIIGSKGKVVFSVFEFVPVRLETPEKIEEFAFEPPAHVQQPLLQTVVDELQGRGTCPSTGVTGARTSRVMDEVIRAYRNPG